VFSAIPAAAKSFDKKIEQSNVLGIEDEAGKSSKESLQLQDAVAHARVPSRMLTKTTIQMCQNYYATGERFLCQI